MSVLSANASLGRCSFVIGGIRSGKSAFGQALAERASRDSGEQVIYVATGEASDEEMERRIAEHRKKRPAAWQTLEIGEELPSLLRETPGERLLLVDSVAEWLSRLIIHDWEGLDRGQLESRLESAIGGLVDAVIRCSARLVLIGHEAGEGSVSPYPMGRCFCDMNGLLNQRLAAEADAVWRVQAGIPLRLK